MNPKSVASQLHLAVSAGDVTDDKLAEVTQQLSGWIRESVPDCDVRQQTEAGVEGAKGFLEVLGCLGITFLEPGALKSLIDCLAVFIKERRREVSITLETPTGTKLTLNAGGIGRAELDAMLHQLGEMTNSGRVAHP